MHRHSDAQRRSEPFVQRWHADWQSVNDLANAIHTLSSRVRGESLLDIGCGGKPYQAWFPNAQPYIGIDIVQANSFADVVAHVNKLPFRSGVFSAAICSQVIEHVQEPGVLLEEAARILKPGGQLIISAPMYWYEHEVPFDFYRYTRYGLEFLLRKSGFEIESLIQQGGAWRVVGQSLANTFQTSIQFRTFGFRALMLIIINTFFDWLDKINFHPEDTCNFAVLARKL